MDFLWDYSIILDIPSYPLNLPRHSLPTSRHPLVVTDECPGYSLRSTEGYQMYPEYSLKYPDKSMSALRTPWHSLMVNPDGPNYLLEFPDGHLMDLYTHWHLLRCEYAFPDTEIFVLSRGKRNCHKKCDIISEREIIDIDAFNPKRFTGSCVYHLFIYVFIFLFIFINLLFSYIK